MNKPKHVKKNLEDNLCNFSTHNCDTNCNSCMNNFNPLLAGLDTGERSILDTDRTHIIFKRGESIFRQGIYPSGLYCLSKGNVMITKSDEFGNTLGVNLHKEVSFLGIADFISNRPYQTTCTALSDVTVCLIRYDNINTFIEGNAAFSKRLLTMLAKQYQQANNRLLAITKKNMNARIADALLELVEVFGETTDGFIDVYLKREELAQLSNMSLANAIRHLSNLQSSGIISIKSKKIKVLNKPALTKESQFG